MQIVVPMSGFGERFRKAGYERPKPLIEVEGKPIIAHVIDLFPGETDFLFVCNQEHLDDPRFAMREILARHCPAGRVVGIAPHKLGPVHAVSQVADLVDAGRPVVVNYCDFACYWDWAHFMQFVAASRCDGAIPAYRGFHPHSLGSTRYAYMRESGGWVLDIQEKAPFTAQPMTEYASSGTYYFATGALMREAFADTQAQGLTVGGEYYASLAYKPLLARGRRIAVYELQHFMQWGTPEDLAEYNMWSDAFRRLVDPRWQQRVAAPGGTLVPMAGLGERFAREGYAAPKPLIAVSGRPMVAQAVHDLPDTPRHTFVLRREMPGRAEIEATLRAAFPEPRIVTLDAATDGQARSALLGLDPGGAWESEALTIAACDNGALYRADRLRSLLADPQVDLIVWVARRYPNAARHPRMYGWVACAPGSDRVTGVSVKAPLADPATDPIVTGTFTFRRGADFARAAGRMIQRGARVNGEFYIDTCIEDALALGLDVRIFEIDSYLCWGTPNDLRTFEYWQSCFDKWPSHPYDLDRDPRVAPDRVEALRSAAAPRVPPLPSR